MATIPAVRSDEEDGPRLSALELSEALVRSLQRKSDKSDSNQNDHGPLSLCQSDIRAMRMLPSPDPILFPGRWSKPDSGGIGASMALVISKRCKPHGCCREHNSGGSNFTADFSTDQSEALYEHSRKGTQATSAMPPTGVFRKLGDWALKSTTLWSAGAPDFASERAYNEACSQVYPHCAVCSLLDEVEAGSRPSEGATALGDSSCTATGAGAAVLPSISKPLLSENVFEARRLGDKDRQQPTLNLNEVDEFGNSMLLVCSGCNLCVHASCYGVLSPITFTKTSWLCRRCVLENATIVACCLCNLSGGALKPTTTGGWAHIICVLANADTFFENSYAREPIVVNRVPKDRKSLKCVYCSVAFPKSGSGDGCVQCTQAKACVTSFHVTCAKAAGTAKFKLSQWPLPLAILCARHVQTVEQHSKEVTALKIGDVVISKRQREQCYDRCTVMKIVTTNFHSVHFSSDNTISKNLYRHDIVDPFPDESDASTLRIGMEVSVLWTDDKLYTGKYLGTNTMTEYVVQFKDGSSATVERKCIYTVDEKLPAKVANRLAKHSEELESVAKENEPVLCSKRQPKRPRRLCDEAHLN